MSKNRATLYKYVAVEYVADIIEKHRLYLNDGSTFNDPFELIVTNRSNDSVDYVKGLHILSLTNSYRNKLIWSHYSNSHKSVCLTVQVPSHLVYPICYSTKRVFNDSNIDELLKNRKGKSKKNLDKSYDTLNKNKKIAYIKDSKWEYEKEYRIVYDENDEKGLIFEENKWFMSVKIKNIYLGVNFEKNDEETKEKILNACKKNKIKISRMVLSENDYSLRVNNKV